MIKLNFVVISSSNLKLQLSSQRENFLIVNITQGILSNLFKILREIIGHSNYEKRDPVLDPELLSTYLNNMQAEGGGIICQILTIKRLMNRKEFSLDYR